MQGDEFYIRQGLLGNYNSFKQIISFNLSRMWINGRLCIDSL